MDKDATVRNPEPNQMNSIFAGLSCRQRDEMKSSRRYKPTV